MARKPRLHVPGGLYHVMLGGNGGQDVFYDEEDRYHLYLLIQQGVERYGHRIHAFCCMTNHIHLAIQVAEDPLSGIMQNLSFRYTRWINKKQARTGHLFQGRYKAILVDAHTYLLELVRYIHLNPVRAGMVEKPEDYAWSGHRAYMGIETLPWLETDWVLSQFAKRLTTCRKRYAVFVKEGIEEGYRQEFHHGGEDGRVLADDRFLEQVLGKRVQPSPEVSLEEIGLCVFSIWCKRGRTSGTFAKSSELGSARRDWLAESATERRFDKRCGDLFTTRLFHLQSADWKYRRQRKEFR
ncbi:MAG: transposase [bacterium]|nr:transposase [bacterium]